MDGLAPKEATWETLDDLHNNVVAEGEGDDTLSITDMTNKAQRSDRKEHIMVYVNLIFQKLQRGHPTRKPMLWAG